MWLQAKPQLSQESLDLFTKLASPEDVSGPESGNCHTHTEFREVQLYQLYVWDWFCQAYAVSTRSQVRNPRQKDSHATY